MNNPATYVGIGLIVVVGIWVVVASYAAGGPPYIGVDTSHYQPVLSTDKEIAEGLTFQFIKTSQGQSLSDGNFAASRKAVQSAGIIPGAYHFLERDNGAAQADFFVSRLKATGGTVGIIPAVDVELQSKTVGPSYADVTDFVTRFHQLLPGRKLVLYTGRWYWGGKNTAGYLHNPPAPVGTVLWISLYVGGVSSPADILKNVALPGATGDPYASDPLNGWPSYFFRQYTSSAVVAGINNVDADVTYHNLTDVKALAGMYPSPSPSVIGSPVVSLTPVPSLSPLPSVTPSVSPTVSPSPISSTTPKPSSLPTKAPTPLPTRKPTPSPVTTPAPTSPPLIGDINSDGRVDILDLSILLTHWGEPARYASGDLNNDGYVTIADLSILLTGWTH